MTMLVAPRALEWHMIARGLDPYSLAREAGLGYTTVRRLLHAREPIHVQLATGERLLEALDRLPVRIHQRGLIGDAPGPAVINETPSPARRSGDCEPVTDQDLMALLAAADRYQDDGRDSMPGAPMLLRLAVAVIRQALEDRRLVQVEDVDAILRTAKQTATYRAEHGMGDPYASDRHLAIDVWTRLRCELVGQCQGRYVESHDPLQAGVDESVSAGELPR